MTTLSHQSVAFNGDKASTFDAFRWVDEKKLAITPGSGYLPFGIGRWACPGRMLAVCGTLPIIFASDTTTKLVYRNKDDAVFSDIQDDASNSRRSIYRGGQAQSNQRPT
jgi:hypothetical protein